MVSNMTYPKSNLTNEEIIYISLLHSSGIVHRKSLVSPIHQLFLAVYVQSQIP